MNQQSNISFKEVPYTVILHSIVFKLNYTGLEITPTIFVERLYIFKYASTNIPNINQNTFKSFKIHLFYPKT